MTFSAIAILLALSSSLSLVNCFVSMAVETAPTKISLVKNTVLSLATVSTTKTIPNTQLKTPKGAHHVSVTRTKWGVDNEHPHEYWFNNQIHSLGNTGFLGAIHAVVAPIATTIIDNVAYDGIDIRSKVAMELAAGIQQNHGARVLDLCCGVGMSTRALLAAFPNAELVLGIDTSPEMLRMAKFMTEWRHVLEFRVHTFKGLLQVPSQSMKGFYEKAACQASFALSNAEKTELPGHSFDLVTVMYSFHEAPRDGRDRILREARRLLHAGGTLVLLDIAADYKPNKHMLAGEPYVLEYQENIHRQMKSVKGFSKAIYKTIVPGHVGMWLLKATSNPYS